MATQISQRRLIISNTVVELYTYEKPYGFNYSPFERRSGVSSIESGVCDNERERKRRDDNLRNVRTSIRRLVECNFQAYGYEPLFLTFTFRENIKDLAVANNYFHDFIRRFGNFLSCRVRYLAVVEFQKRGAVHYHCIFFNIPLWVEEAERCPHGQERCDWQEIGACSYGKQYRNVAKLWKHGFVDIERIRSAKRVGAYVCKYLDKSVLDTRLVGQKAYFTSKGLLRSRVLRNEKDIDAELEKHIIKEVLLESSFSTINYSLVKYKQYLI